MPKTELYEVVTSNNLSEILTGETGTFVAVPRGSTDIPANALCIRAHEAGSILGISTVDGTEYDLLKVSESPFVPVLEAFTKAANHWHKRQFTSQAQVSPRKMAAKAA
jgi:hypothetical protein